MSFLPKQGDTRPYLTELLFDGEKKYFDPTGYTPKFNMAKASTNIIDHGTAFMVSVSVGSARAAVLAGLGYLTAAGAAFTAGTYNAVEYRWDGGGGTDTTTAGDMAYEWELTNGAAIITFPDGTNNTGTIAPQVK